MTTERRELVARIWSRDPTVWTGKDEARWLGWLDEPFRMRDDAEPLLRLVEDVVGDAEAVVLLGMGGSSLAPEVMRALVRGRELPRPRHDAPAGDPRARGEARPRADALHLRVEVGLDARDPLAHRLLLEARAARRAVGRDHRPRLDARRARARAQVRRRHPGRADDRRPLLGALAVRDRSRPR